MVQQADKRTQKSVADYNKRFTVIALVAFAFGALFAAYFGWIASYGVFTPEPVFLRDSLPILIIAGVLVVLSIIGGTVIGGKSVEAPVDDEAPWRKWTLIVATFLLILFISLPSFALGGPFLSGFAHPLLAFGSLAIIVTGSNAIRFSIMGACIVAFCSSMAIMTLQPSWWPWHVHYEVVKGWERGNEWWHSSFILISIIITVLLTFDKKDKKSWFDKISTFTVAADEEEIRTLALGMSTEGKIKLINELQGNLNPVNNPTK